LQANVLECLLEGDRLLDLEVRGAAACEVVTALLQIAAVEVTACEFVVEAELVLAVSSESEVFERFLEEPHGLVEAVGAVADIAELHKDNAFELHESRTKVSCDLGLVEEEERLIVVPIEVKEVSGEQEKK